MLTLGQGFDLPLFGSSFLFILKVNYYLNVVNHEMIFFLYL